MSKELTPEKAKAYIDSEGATCPYCEATDITGRSLEVDADVVTQTIDCENCHEQWIDVYRLVGLADPHGNRIDIPQDECPWKPERCREAYCAIWDRDGQRCSLLTIAIHTKRL